jgi:hypothetical protein
MWTRAVRASKPANRMDVPSLDAAPSGDVLSADRRPQVPEFVFDLLARCDCLRDLVLEDIAELPSQAVNRHLDGALRDAKTAGRVRITESRLIAREIGLQRVELFLFPLLNGVVFQSRHDAIEERQGPSPVERAFWSLRGCPFETQSAFRLVELEGQRGNPATAFGSRVAGTLICREVLQRLQEEGTESPPGRVGQSDDLLLEQQREERLRQVLGIRRTMTSPAEKGVQGIPICFAESRERFTRMTR